MSRARVRPGGWRPARLARCRVGGEERQAPVIRRAQDGFQHRPAGPEVEVRKIVCIVSAFPLFTTRPGCRLPAGRSRAAGCRPSTCPLNLGGGDLVADALAGDPALELGEAQQQIERQPAHAAGGVECLTELQRRSGRLVHTALRGAGAARAAPLARPRHLDVFDGRDADEAPDGATIANL